MSIRNLFQPNNYTIYADSIITESITTDDLDANNIITNNINIIDKLELDGDVGDDRQVVFSDGTNAKWDNIVATDIAPGPNDYYLYSNGTTSKWIDRNAKFCVYTPQGAYPDVVGISLEPDAQDIAEEPILGQPFTPIQFQNDIYTNSTIISKSIDNTRFTAQQQGYYKITLCGPVIEDSNSILFIIFKNGNLNINDCYGFMATSPIDASLFSQYPHPVIRHAIAPGATLVRIIELIAGDYIGIYTAMQASSVVSLRRNYFTGYGSASLTIEFLGGNLIIN